MYDGGNGTNVFFCSEYFECAKWAKEFSNEMCVRARELCVCVLLSQCERPDSELERRDHRHRYRTAANRQLPVITGYKHRPYCALVCLSVCLSHCVCECAIVHHPQHAGCLAQCATIPFELFGWSRFLQHDTAVDFFPQMHAIAAATATATVNFFHWELQMQIQSETQLIQANPCACAFKFAQAHTHTHTCNTHSYLPSICNNSNNYSVTNYTQMLFNRFEIYWKCKSKCKCNGTNSAHQHRSSSLRIEYVARISLFLSHLQIYSFQLRLPRLLVVVVVTEWLFANKSVRAYDEAGE